MGGVLDPVGKGNNYSDLKGIARLRPGTPEIAICARWRINAFSDVLGNSYEQEVARLNEFASVEQGQAGFVAYWGETPVGTCLLVPKEIEPCQPVTPWLAGLFVAGEFRGRGLGKALVNAAEQEARQQGNGQIYLYADDEAEPLYHKLGWTVAERDVWQGVPTVLMSKRLAFQPKYD
jgi:GNAT superfamily N-acetyltransferase